MILCETDHSFGVKVTLIVLLLLLLSIALPAYTKEYQCGWCCSHFSGEPGAYWGTKRFCSQACKDSFWDREYERTRRCKHCGIRVDPGSTTSNTVVGDTVYMTIGHTWDGYCETCREGIHKKWIDPSRPEYQFEPQYRCPPEEKPAPPPPPPEQAQAAGTTEGGAARKPDVAKGVDAGGKGGLVGGLKYALLAAGALLGFYYWRRA